MKSLKQYANNSILIIDDEEKFVRVAVKFLTGCGFKKIHYALTGIEGINQAKKIKPDIVLLDYELPGMSGFEVLNHFHENKLDFKVILITAHDTGLVGMRGARLGITDFVSKTEFYENIDIKIIEALEFGCTISDKSNTPQNIIATNFDILEKVFKTYDLEKQNELIAKLNQLRDEVNNNQPDKSKIKTFMDFIKHRVAGDFAAVGIVEVLKGLLSLI